MHPYRTHRCGDLRRNDVGSEARLSGWVHRKRDHGQLLFIDLRDHAGIAQLVFQPGTAPFAIAEAARLESVLTVTGKVVARTPETVNPSLPTGEVELVVADCAIESAAETLPLQVNAERDYPEETRLKYRFLDLRREKMQRNIVLRSQIIASIRRRMIEQGFTEYQTPILTASSPEGARDFLVPSRLHPGKFYALPQAPQQYKQLYMISGFDRYFQIAPCFRDEDARADRSPGEFYQLDIEMSFATQEDVFAAVEPVMHGLFCEFSDWEVTPTPFPRITFADAMLRYGSDKPDLRNPVEIADVTEAFRGSGFKVFAGAIEKGAVVRAVPAPGAVGRPRSFFDGMVAYAQSQGAPGLGWIQLARCTHDVTRDCGRVRTRLCRLPLKHVPGVLRTPAVLESIPRARQGCFDELHITPKRQSGLTAKAALAKARLGPSHQPGLGLLARFPEQRHQRHPPL